MKICAAQLRSVPGDIEANLDKHDALIDLALSHQAEMIIFPELSLTGYEPALAKALATSADDPRLQPFQTISNKSKIVIGVGLPTKRETHACISMILFQPNQKRKTYSKKYLHEDEEPYFVSGDNFPTLKIGETTIGLAICYELSVPQHAEAAYQHGAQLYAASVAKHARGMTQAGERLAKIARGYGIPTLIANSLGPSDNFVGSGQSAAWNSAGERLNTLDSERDGILLFDTETGATKAIHL